MKTTLSIHDLSAMDDAAFLKATADFPTPDEFMAMIPALEIAVDYAEKRRGNIEKYSKTTYIPCHEQ